MVELFSLYPQSLDQWFRDNIAQDFPEIRTELSWFVASRIRVARNRTIGRFRCTSNRPTIDLEVARMIREYFLQQNGFHEVDAYCDINLQYQDGKAILAFQESAKSAMASGAQLGDVVNVPSRSDLMRGRLNKGYIDTLMTWSKP